MVKCIVETLSVQRRGGLTKEMSMSHSIHVIYVSSTTNEANELYSTSALDFVSIVCFLKAYKNNLNLEIHTNMSLIFA